MEQHIAGGVIYGLVETSPGVFEWTGSPQDWMMPRPTISPSFHITEEEAPESAGARFTEGLFIAEKDELSSVIDTLSTVYDVSVYPSTGLSGSGMVIDQPATKYLITHNLPGTGSPTITVESVANPGIYDSGFSTSPFAYDQLPSVVSTHSFILTLSPGFDVPFRLTIS
jgi:hypothetical protein